MLLFQNDCELSTIVEGVIVFFVGCLERNDEVGDNIIVELLFIPDLVDILLRAGFSTVADNELFALLVLFKVLFEKPEF